MIEKFCNTWEVVCLKSMNRIIATIEKSRNCIRSTVLVYCKYQSLSLAIKADQKKVIQLQSVTACDFISPSGC